MVTNGFHWYRRGFHPAIAGGSENKENKENKEVKESDKVTKTRLCYRTGMSDALINEL